MNIPVTQTVSSPGANATGLLDEEFDPFNLTDPFPFYRRARKEAPIIYSAKVNSWAFFRHGDIRRSSTTGDVFVRERPIALLAFG